MFVTGYSCFACSRTQPDSFNGMVCPECGGNLDLTYDYSAVSEAIKGGFENDQPGLFRYQALLPVQQPETTFPLKVGDTPLYAAKRLGESTGLPSLWFKDDSSNPSASFKDRASAVVLLRAIETGATTVATASTGNAGASLACLAAATGQRAIILVPENAPKAKLSQSLAFGTRVLAVKGSYDDAFDLCLAASEQFGWFNRSTGLNPYTREGKKTCAFEIWEDLGHRVPDRIVVPTGDGNILSGIWKGWRDLHALGLIDRMPRLDCVQSEASAAICQTIRRLRDEGLENPDWSLVKLEKVKANTIADSISVDKPRDGLAATRAVIESGGATAEVSDKDILAAIVEVARTTGLFPEPAAAASWAGLKQLLAEEKISSDETVVCLLTGSGLKDTSGVLRALNSPVVIEPELSALHMAIGA